MFFFRVTNVRANFCTHILVSLAAAQLSSGKHIGFLIFRAVVIAWSLPFYFFFLEKELCFVYK